MIAYRNKNTYITAAFIVLLLFCLIKRLLILLDEVLDYPIPNYPIPYLIEAMDASTVIILKVFADQFILVLIIVVTVRSCNLRETNFVFLLITLKCVDTLLFVAISGLIMHGYIDNQFDETFILIMMALIFSTIYAVCSYLLYIFLYRNAKRNSDIVYMWLWLLVLTYFLTNKYNKSLIESQIHNSYCVTYICVTLYWWLIKRYTYQTSRSFPFLTKMSSSILFETLDP